MKSTIDIIVPCYNYGRYLRQCVHSLLGQEGVEVRVLIIDDASSDDTQLVGQQLALEDQRVTYRRHDVNRGHIATYNEGIEWLRAEFMLLISADDYVLPGAFHRGASLMRRDPSVSFTFGSVIELLPDGTQTTVVPRVLLGDSAERVYSGSEFMTISGARNFVATPTAVVRTSVLQRVGGYRKELPHTGDMEMWLRLAAHGTVGVIGRPQAIWRKHNNNMSNGYSIKSRLPELQQKKAALDWFIKDCAQACDDAEPLYRLMLRSLGQEAIGCASAALNEGNSDLAKEIVSFSLSICPEVKQSWAWKKFIWKQRIGPRAWRVIAPAHRAVRSLSASNIDSH